MCGRRPGVVASVHASPGDLARTDAAQAHRTILHQGCTEEGEGEMREGTRMDRFRVYDSILVRAPLVFWGENELRLGFGVGFE